MEKQSKVYRTYLQILKEELIPAMGCTEPISIAYAGPPKRGRFIGCIAGYGKIGCQQQYH